MLYIFIFIIFGLLCYCIYGAILSAKSTSKRKSLQQQADNNFQTTNGNYKFYYSIKSFKNDGIVKARIFTEPVLGFSDLNTADTNNFYGITVSINNEQLESSVEQKGLRAMCEFIIPLEYIKDDEINAAITVTTTWFLGNKKITDTLNFNYNKKLC